MPENEYDNLLKDASLTPLTGNEYDPLSQSIHQNNASEVRASFTEANKTTPEAAAEIDTLSTQTGLAPDLIERNREQVQEKAKIESNDYDRMVREFPVTADYFKDHAFAKVAQDDAQRLPIWEQFSRGITDTGQFFQQGKDVNRTGELGYLKMTGQLNDAGTKELAGLDQIGQQENNFGFLYDVLTNTAELTGQFVDPTIEAVQTGAAVGAGFAGITALAGQAGPQALTPEELITVPAAAVGGFGVGATASFADHAYRVEAGHAFLEFQQIKDDQGNPLDPVAVKAAAQIVGVMNAGLEMTGLSLIAKATGLNKLSSLTMRKQVTQLFQRPGFQKAFVTFAKRYATAWGGEVSTEILQEGTNIVMGELLKMSQEEEGVTFNDSELTLAEASSRLSSIAYKVGTGMIIPAGGAASVNLAIDTKKAIQARETQRTFEALTQSAQETKLLELAPQRFRDFVAQATKDGPIENIYIKADQFNEYFQSQGIDPREAAAQIPGIQEQYEEANQSGGDLQIKTADYAAVIAPTEHNAGLSRLARFHAEDMSLAEAEQFESEIQNELTAEAERIIAQAEERDRVEAPIDQFYDQLRRQLSNAGRSPSAAASEAALVTAMFRTEAQRSGVPAQELIDRWQVRVQREFPESVVDPTDLMIDALRDRRFVPPKDLFGPSLGEFLKERGGIQTDRDLPQRLAQAQGLSLESAVEAAREAGFPVPEDLPSEDALLAALESEAGGDVLRSVQLINQQAVDREQALDDLQRYLEQIGLDIRDASNKEVKDAIAKGFAENQIDSDELRTLYQGEQTQDSLIDRVANTLRNLFGREETFFQEPTEGPPRGSITFGDETIIRLHEAADLSTFLHESGHLFLEVMKDLATEPEASEGIQQDFQKALDFLGVAPGQEIVTEHHEKWAKAFEVYLFEGKAPSVELQSVFQRFRAWLMNVYQRMTAIGVELNEEIRGVFDRMLATEEEIASAQTQARTDPLFQSAEAMGVSRETYQQYLDSAQKMTDDATRELERKALNEMRREAKAWWKEQWAAVREDVEDEFANKPVYQAIRFFNGERIPAGLERVQLSKQDLIDMYDGPEILKRLQHHGRTRRSLYTVDGGAHPNAMADLFGYQSGDDMIQAIINTPKFKEAVNQETDRVMKERHGDILADGSMAEEALDALHTDQRAVFLETELKALSARANRPSTPAATAKAIAEAVMGRKLIRDAGRKGQYHIAEVKAAKAAERAMLEGDMTEATTQKRYQLLNYYLYREANTISEEIDKTLRYLGKFEKPGTRKNLARDYLDQIDAILEPFDLRRSVTIKELERRQNLRDWIDQKTTEGEEVTIDPDVVDRAKLKHYKEMTVDEFLAMRDAVKNIEHLARLKQKLLQQKGKREFNDVVANLVDSARENNKWSPVPLDFAPTRFKRYKQWAKEFVAEHVKMEFLFHQLDGNKFNGAFWTHLFKPLADAEIVEQTMQEKMVGLINEAFNVYSKLERDHLFKERRFYTDLIHVPEMDRSFSKGALMSMALNWGNEGNRQALLNGYGWNASQVEAALNNLTENDWNAVQKIWDAIDTLWPDIAKLQKELTGVVPEKVAPTQVLTKHGAFNGGYYPLKYDASVSHEVFQREEKENSADLFESSWMRPATRKGHTIERLKNVSRPVKLEMSVLTEHINNVIHDITHRKAIMDVDRLTRDPRVREAIESTAGRELYREIRPWLQAIAREQRQLTTSIEKLIGHFRVGATIVNMGWKVTTAIVQPLGFFNSVELLGEKYAWRGLKAFYGNPLKVKEKADIVFEKSTMMRNRQKTFDRDVRDALKRYQKGGLEYNFNQTLLAHIGFFDMMVSMPTWMGTYEKATAEGLSEEDSIAAADSMVRMSQSAGGTKDLAAIQRGGEFKRSLTMFYSYFSVLFNQMRRRGQLTIKDKDVPRAITGFLYLVILPAVLSELITGRGPDDDEEWAEWLSKTIGGYPFQSMVGVRDVASALTTDYGYDITPVAGAIGDVLRGADSIFDAFQQDDEFNRTDVRNIWIGTGYLLHLPSRQTWNMIDEILDTSEGHDFSLFEFFVTRDKEER